jgi:hypothetical protein
MEGKLRWLPLAICLLSAMALAQEAKLEHGQPIEREIAGGESHKYTFTLQPGQFVRVVVEQKRIDVALKIAAPDGEPLIEANFGDVGELESVSVEAAAGGEYQLTIKAQGAAGAYRVRLEVKAAASAQDKQRITAERLLVEVSKSFHQGAKAIAATIEKARQALTLWRELGDRPTLGSGHGKHNWPGLCNCWDIRAGN